MQVFLGIVLFVAFLALVVTTILLIRANSKKGKVLSVASIITSIGSIVMLALFIFLPFGIMTVETGQMAVVKVWGEAVEVKEPGLHFRNIISTKYEYYDLRLQQLDNESEVYTKDAQPLQMQTVIQFSLDSENLLNISRKYGTLDMLKLKIEKVSIEKAKVILAAKTAMELIETRATLSPDVMTAIKEMEDQYHITIESVAIIDMSFSSAFEIAVENKMVAEQEKLKADYDKQKAIIKAEEELEVAKLAAERALAAAKGVADAQIEVARGEARSMKLKSIEVARALGCTITEIDLGDGETDYEIDTANSDPEAVKLITEYLKYTAYLEAWDGVLPEVVAGDNISMILPGK